MNGVEPLDRAWLAAHPLPSFDGATDKNSRGQLLLVGGSPMAPAALLLSGEAALRVGCGKVQLGVAAAMVPALAAAFPEAGMLALPTDAEGLLDPGGASLLAEPMARADAMLIGCGMHHCPAAGALTARLIERPRPDFAILIDAGACAASRDLAQAIGAHRGRIVLTPHPGEMALLMDTPVDQVTAQPERIVRAAVDRFGAVVLLRAERTLIGAPGGTMLLYPGGGIGLATGGSGDVVAGVIGGLLARGADPLTASAWGVWLHGEAGRTLGPPGFLARELSPVIGALLAGPL